MNRYSIRKKLNYLAILDGIADPYFAREFIFFLVIFISYMSFSSYTSSFYSGVSMPFISLSRAISIVAVSFFLCNVFYVIAVVSYFSSLIRSGAMAFLFTMPIGRLKFYFMVYSIMIFFSSILFISAFLILIYLFSFAFNSIMFIQFLVIMEAMLFFYGGIGMAIASVLKSGTATFIILSSSILGLMFYSSKIYPNVNWLQVIIKGVLFLPGGRIGLETLVLESAILIGLSYSLVFLGYFLLRFKNLRSGKNA